LEAHLRQEFNDRVRSRRGVLTDVGLEELMSNLIRQLPEAQQEAVRLTFYEGLSPSEIADQKALPLGTVKMRLKLARKKLFHQLVALEETI
jgi:RNA polymerase sigma-70 factor (ECF subfamily)